MKKYLIGLFLLVSHGLAAQIWTNLLPYSNSGSVFAMHVHQGKLYCGGGFTSCFPPYGNMIECYIASFDGQYWGNVGQTPLDSLSGFGPGVDRTVYVINKSGNNIIVGGDFGKAGVWDSLNRRKLAGFNGTDWYSVYSAFTPAVYPSNVNDVLALQYYQGKLYIGGYFSQFGPLGTVSIAAYDSLSGWSALDGGLSGPGGHVKCMAIYNNELYVGGSFSSAGSSNMPVGYIAKWNGMQWDSVGPGFDGEVRTMVVDTVSNILYVGGGFTRSGNDTINGIAKWDGNQWTPVGSGQDLLYGTLTMCMFNGELYAGGSNYTITTQGDTLSNVYRFNGIKWVGLNGGGANSAVFAMAVYNGNLIISGGAITSCGNVPVNNIACYGNTCPTNVGINSIYPIDPEILVFPNPAKGRVYIEVKGTEGIGESDFFLQLFDAQGKRIHSEIFSGKTSFSTEKTAKGICFVSISDEKGRIIYSGKLVLE